MTPLLTRLSRGSKKLLANNKAKRKQKKPSDTRADTVVRIELIPSRTHQTIHLGLATLAFLAPLGAELPFAVTIFSCVWVLGSVAYLYRKSERIKELRDEGETWLLVSASRADRVRYKTTDYLCAYFIIISFSTRTGHVRRVCIWRDAVTAPAFSWISARVTLAGADKRVKFMSTSGYQHFFRHH